MAVSGTGALLRKRSRPNNCLSPCWGRRCGKERKRSAAQVNAKIVVASRAEWLLAPLCCASCHEVRCRVVRAERRRGSAGRSLPVTDYHRSLRKWGERNRGLSSFAGRKRGGAGGCAPERERFLRETACRYPKDAGNGSSSFSCFLFCSSSLWWTSVSTLGGHPCHLTSGHTCPLWVDIPVYTLAGVCGFHTRIFDLFEVFELQKHRPMPFTVEVNIWIFGHCAKLTKSTPI